MNCHIEIFMDGRWITAAVFEPQERALDLGIGGGGWLQYDIDYAVGIWAKGRRNLSPGSGLALNCSPMSNGRRCSWISCREAPVGEHGSGVCRLKEMARKWIGICS